MALLAVVALEPGAFAQPTAQRGVEPVIVKGVKLAGWSGPAATIVCDAYPSGGFTGTRNAHGGTFVPTVATGIPVNEIAAYRWNGMTFEEIPVQVDEMYPYCLANPNSDFGIYSGTDLELSYAWDVESWKMTEGVCSKQYAPGDGPVPDPVATLDDDDEVVFMASDAGSQAPLGATPPAGTTDSQAIVITDPLDPATLRYVYLFRKLTGSTFSALNGYVQYARDANADEYIDRYSFSSGDPEQLGSSNTGYGPNLDGTVCVPPPAHNSAADDRFPRDGVTVSTGSYKWRASGRWMVRGMQVAAPGQPVVHVSDAGFASRVYGADLIDRWKGRAFQQAPDSTISLVGFEDEQVNWEANSSLLGERVGPVRAIRETWGADSGTNVTKTEAFYRDAITYRYHVRVHPIPPDGLYTSWDYNAGVAVKYYNAIISATDPDGADVDGVNDDQGNVDGVSTFPAYFDAPDPTFSPPSSLLQWEQVSGSGGNGSLVYIVELKGATTLENPAVVPYYRDDSCLDDGTGDNPVQRPWPGESSSDIRVQNGYCAAAGKSVGCHVCRSATDLVCPTVAAVPCGNAIRALAPYVDCKCGQTQGAYASHGIHYFVTNDTDNSASPGTLTEIDAQQWQFAVPTAAPANVGEPYGNVVVTPLQTAAVATGAAPSVPPVASNQSVTTPEGVAVPITLSGTDVDTCELTFAIASPPSNGMLGAITGQTCASGLPNTDSASVTYTPNPGFSGSDSFTFPVNDGTNTSLAATVSITVTPTCGNGMTDAGEQCDEGAANGAAGSCCSATCTFVAAGTSCRDAAGVCDVAETCTGASALCTADARGTGTCRPAADACDAAESCDGGTDCPDDVFQPDGTSCDDGISCTNPDQCAFGACSGTSVTCGDGVQQPACGEECDDGNVTGGDGCSSTCREDPGYPLHVVSAILRQQTNGAGNGKIRVVGYFLTHPPADTFDASEDIEVRVQDGSGHDVMRTFVPGTCRTAPRRIVCRDGNRLAVFLGYPTAAPARGYRLRMVLRDQPLDAPFSGPVTATVTHGPGRTRAGAIGTCSQTASGLRCRQQL
jgi:cysteine-rich repeat protein